VAEKVSEVPNSKYHSLFFVLKGKNKTTGSRTERAGNVEGCFPPTSKSEACSVASPVSLYAELVEIRPLCKKGVDERILSNYTQEIHLECSPLTGITPPLISKECIMWLVNPTLKRRDESEAGGRGFRGSAWGHQWVPVPNIRAQ